MNRQLCDGTRSISKKAYSPRTRRFYLRFLEHPRDYLRSTRVCPVCGKRVNVRKDGRLALHVRKNAKLTKHAKAKSGRRKSLRFSRPYARKDEHL